jgi:hypothetical protein
VERIGQELHGGVGEVQDDPVHGSDRSQDAPRVAFADLDAVGPVRGHILSEELDRGGIGVGSDDPRGLTAPGDEDGVRPHAGEGIRDDLPGGDLGSHAPPFAPKPGAEVGASHVHAVPEAELRVDGRRPRLSRDDLEVPDAEHSRDAPIPGDRVEIPIPREDRAADFRPVRNEGFRDFEDGHIPDHVEGGRQLGPQRVRHADHVLVAPDGPERLLEVPLLRGPPEIEALRGGDAEMARVLLHLEVLLEHAAVLQGPPNLLAPLARHDDAPGAHGDGHAAKRMKSFRGGGG